MYLYQLVNKVLSKFGIHKELNVHQQNEEGSAMQTNEKVLTFESQVNCIECSSDGELIFCGVRQEIKVFNSTLTILKAKLIGHTERVDTVKIFQNVLIATAGMDVTIRLWNAQTFKQIAVLQGHGICSKIVEFSSQTILVSVGYDYELIIWSISRAQQIFRTSVSKVMISDTLQLPNDQIVIYKSYCGSLQIWDTKTIKHIKSLNGAKQKDQSIITLNGRVMSTGKVQGKIAFCDLRRGRVIRTFNLVHTKNQIAVDPEHKFFQLCVHGRLHCL